MDWNAFLEEISDYLRLTPEQRDVFLARLSDENARESEANVAAQLNISAAALKKHMNAIYNLASQEFPSLTKIQSRGKLKELRASLKQSWKKRDASLEFQEKTQSSPKLEGLDVTSSLQITHQSPLKHGAPFPMVRLPENFVERPDALRAVKDKLLSMSDKTLVVNAIAGLGGLGKSVLAAALVLDQEVQARFKDGILWVTLGQNPDLQTMLGEWIRELDKSREVFSANTLESASRYLHSLLIDRQMLLVVDDVWNSAHTDWFRVGGVGCRVLVTTREARIDNADYYPLELMSEEEALSLMRQKLGIQWQSEQELEAKAFANVIGYLPLALDLAVNQVRDGLSWTELRSEFESERRSIAIGAGWRSSALKLLDSSEKWNDLDENQQRKYSLQACFNLSLKRLNREQLQQFAWLGVLPEDVNLDQSIASVLWNLSPLLAKRALLLMRNRSFLTEGVTALSSELTFRIHDLMHDMARSLIAEGTLKTETQPSTDTAQNLPLAHRQFLQRYRERAVDHRWDKLPNDGYIYRHLTWHMEQAHWAEEIHTLVAMSNEQGRNAWFEVCDLIGQPAIFVEDVVRGWRLAEQEYEQDQTGAITLQCRYSLITATLNQLIGNLPVGLMAELVKRNFWTVEQAWAYLEQMQDERKVTETIKALAKYLPISLLQIALKKAKSIHVEADRAEVLIALAEVNGSDFDHLLEAAKTIQNEHARISVLRFLAKVDGVNPAQLSEIARLIQDDPLFSEDILSALEEVDVSNFNEALARAKATQNEPEQAEVLIALAKVDGSDLAQLLETAKTIQTDYTRAEVLSALAKVDGAYFAEALAAAKTIQWEYNRAQVLSALAKVDGANLAQLLAAARAIQDGFWRAEVLSALAKVDGAYFAEALEATRAIQSEFNQAKVLSALAEVDGANLAQLLAAARAIQDESWRAKVLSDLAKVDGAYFAEALEAARAIKGKSQWAEVLGALAEVDGADLAQLLETARAIGDEDSWAKVLSDLVKVDGAYFAEALEAARAIQDEFWRAVVLSDLAKVDRAYFAEALETARAIQDEFNRAKVLGALAEVDGANFAQLLEATRAIQNDYMQASILHTLAKANGAYFAEALAAAGAIQDEFQDESWRAVVLSDLAKVDGAYFAEALEAARAIQDESWRATVLSDLAKVDGTCFAEVLARARAIQDESWRAAVLSDLTKVDGACFAEALKAARLIQDESWRATVLSDLAKVDGTCFAEALEAARTIQSEYRRAVVLNDLAKVDGTCFAEALEAARTIQSEYRRAEVLNDLAKIEGIDFTQLLEATKLIQNEFRRAELLRKLAQQVPQKCLLNLLDAILELTHKPICAKTLSDCLSHFSPAELSYSNWKTCLHILSHRRRADLIEDFVTLYSTILHLGGESAVQGVVNVIREVFNQWK